VLDEWYPDADRVLFVVDNLSTHSPAAFYEAFPPAEARRLTERVEWHYTPKHGSWLNVAELELSVLARQCLDRRIPDTDALRQEAAAWEANRNAAVVTGRGAEMKPGPHGFARPAQPRTRPLPATSRETLAGTSVAHGFGGRRRKRRGRDGVIATRKRKRPCRIDRYDPAPRLGLFPVLGRMQCSSRFGLESANGRGELG
jgi:hypothetical protein